MNIQTRKLNFVQEFLQLSNEGIIDKLAAVLKQERKKQFEKSIKPMSLDGLNKLIDKAEKDAKEGRVTEAKALKKAIKAWD
jgi:soluble cytochrome b562